MIFGLALYFGYPKIFSYTPRSTHMWRQTDSASLALNYYKDGLPFFKPRMHFMMGDVGYVAGAGEAPIFYYFVAIFYSIFGPHEGIFRLLSLLTFLIGLYLIAKILALEAKDWYSPIILAGLIMSCPVIAFYSFNFTPNIPAQGLAMIGIWYFYRFYKTGIINLFYWSMLFYALAGLIKITALMSLFVIAGLYLLDTLGYFKKINGKRIFNKTWKYLPGFLSVIFIILCWKTWADNFNDQYNTHYFLSKIRPFWEEDEATKAWVFKRIKEIWFPAYYEPFTFWGLASIGALILLSPWKHKAVLYLSYLGTLLGCTAFFFLFYHQFEKHDYYIIEMILLPILIISQFFLFLKNHLPRLFSNWIFRITLLALFFFNAHYAKNLINQRFEPDSVFMSFFNPDLFKTEELQKFLSELDIQESDIVVSAPDSSPNNTLYHYDRRGWTELFMGGKMHAGMVKVSAQKGAKYLFIHDKSYLVKENLKEVLAYPMGNFNNSIFVFDIRPYKN